MNASLSIDITVDNLESIVTSKVCDGQVITVDYEGDTSGEHKVKYHVHNHDNSVDCDNNCVVTDINIENNVLETNYIPIFISSLSQKQTGFVQEFVNNKNFELFAENYFCGIDFYLNGNARLNGLLWTFECNILNEELSSISFNGNNLEMPDFLQYLENSILTSVNSQSIKVSLGTSDEETAKIKNLSEKYQLNLQMSHEYVQLPSYNTMFKIKPDVEYDMNLQSSRILLEIMKTKLLQLTDEDKLSLTTEDWLMRVGRVTRFTSPDDFTLNVHINEQQIKFKLDPRLDVSIDKLGSFIGLYHYTLSCSPEEYSIILKRIRISDCFTVPYNATLLKAFGERVETIPIYSMQEYWQFAEKYMETPPTIENTEISHLSGSHALVSVVELYGLIENKRIKDINSVSTEYISAYEKNKPKFKRIQVPTDTCYELPGYGYFEKLSSNLLRHFGRMNAEHLLLVETALHFDPMPKNDALEIFQLYKDNMHKIPNGTIHGVYGEIFPMYILCNNKQVLKLRKRRKCLQIPNFHTLSKEEKYGRILLYYPIRSGQTIDVERLGSYNYK